MGLLLVGGVGNPIDIFCHALNHKLNNGYCFTQEANEDDDFDCSKATFPSLQQRSNSDILKNRLPATKRKGVRKRLDPMFFLKHRFVCYSRCSSSPYFTFIFFDFERLC